MIERAFSPFEFEQLVLEWIVRKCPEGFRTLYKTDADIRQLILMYFKVCEASTFMILLALSPFAPPYFLEHAHPLPIVAFLLCVIIGFFALAFTHSRHIANAVVVVGSMICVLGYSVAWGGVYSQMSRHGQTVFFLNVIYGHWGMVIGIVYNILSSLLLYIMESNGYNFTGDKSPEELLKIFSVHSLYLNFTLFVIMAGYERHHSRIIADIAKANQYKTEFLCRMSHELRTPLVGIVGAIDILGSANNITSDQFKLIQIARNCANNLLGIINDVLDFSKIEAQMMKLHIESVNLKELVDTCTQVVTPLMTANPKIQLHVDFDAQKLPQKFLGDSLRIRQVLINLLSNAIKFTEQGTITVKVSLRKSLGALPWTSTLGQRPQILRVPSSVFTKKGSSLQPSSSEGTIRTATDQPNDKSYLVFSVKDTGVGIDKKHILKVFDAFEQGDANTSARYGGSGLGLAISKRICLLHGGDIAVVSNGKDQGASFYFYIPYHEANASHDNAKMSEYFNGNSVQSLQAGFNPDYRLPPIPRASTQDQTVLIDGYKNATSLRESSDARPEKMLLLLAEDNKVNQIVISALLKKLNCSVDIANNGREAVEKTRQKHYDLIFMDIEMPEMNGLEAAVALRKQLIPTPIVALTAHALSETREEALKSGMREVITKPCTFEQLQSVCDTYVNKQNGSSYD